jgi:hypothetical protein
VYLYFIFDLGTREGEGSASRPGRTLPPRKSRYSLYRRLGGGDLRAGLDRCGKSRPHRDSIPGPSSPVGSRYTDYATRLWKEVKEGYVTSYPHRYLLGAFEYPEVLNLGVTRYSTAGRIRVLLPWHTTLKPRLICSHFLYFKELLPVMLRFDAHHTCTWVVNMQNAE